LAAAIIVGCAHRKTPVLLEVPPERPFEVIQEIETKVEWHGMQWLWFWWHYMPWYSASHRVHNKTLIRKARKLGADAVIDVKYLPHRAGAQGKAIRYV
jgi:hypothetical protein